MTVVGVRNQRLSFDEFLMMRKETLSKWPTGQEVDLEDAVAYHRSMPKDKNLARLVAKAKKDGKTLIYPRGGVALLEDQIKLLVHLQDHGGADYLPTTTDSYTRNEKFKNAQDGIEKSESSGKSMLNGFPVVNYGVRNCRRIVESIKVPAMVLPGTPFAMTIAETAFAAGYTGLLGSGISDTIRFTKELSIEQGIRNYQYVDRLAAYYAENGVPMQREQTGFLTGTLIPPGIAVAIAVLDCLLAAGQGLKHYSMGLGQNINLVQDVAALRVLPEICSAYLEMQGFMDVSLATGSHHWMGAFPQDEAEALSIVSMGTVIAVMGSATHVCTKTTHEAVGIPTAEANAAGLRATKKVIKMMRHYRFPQAPEIDEEMEIIGKEACGMVDRVLEMGDGDPALGAVRGFQAGIIDVPWAPSKYVANKVMPARDRTGAIRYLDCGDLAISEEVKAYHRRKLEERGKRENREVDLEMAIDDVSEIARSIV